MKPRNYLVPKALFRKAGAHKKSRKAVRAKLKQDTYNQVNEEI